MGDLHVLVERILGTAFLLGLLRVLVRAASAVVMMIAHLDLLLALRHQLPIFYIFSLKFSVDSNKETTFQLYFLWGRHHSSSTSFPLMGLFGCWLCGLDEPALGLLA
jgi:hypothetical protein